jgi:hypothetical protein
MNIHTTSKQLATATPAAPRPMAARTRMILEAPMWRRSIRLAAILPAALCLLLHGAKAQPVCKPVLTVKQVRFSEMVELKRFWTATLDVDASRCATTSGQFAIRFVRLAENAPDLDFAERFTWRAGRMDVVVEFWADESVHDYGIEGVAACPCRSD